MYKIFHLSHLKVSIRKYNNKSCQTENLEADFFADGKFLWNSVEWIYSHENDSIRYVSPCIVIPTLGENKVGMILTNAVVLHNSCLHTPFLSQEHI